VDAEIFTYLQYQKLANTTTEVVYMPTEIFLNVFI